MIVARTCCYVRPPATMRMTQGGMPDACPRLKDAMMRRLTLMISSIGMMLAVQTAVAQTRVTHEQEIRELRLGQRVQVDDGACPAGQIKEISGSTLTAKGVVWVRKCIPRSR